MIKVSCNVDRVIARLNKKKKSLDSRHEAFLYRLGKEGIDIANVKIQTVQYDGTVDLSTLYEVDKDTVRIIVKSSGGSKTPAITFIEFGTGVHYSEQHPLNWYERGGYGLHLGLNDHWYYQGDPGTHGEVRTTKKGKTVVRTEGNPPNRVVYNTGKELREKVLEIARKVYSDD